jgi:hypothetical protein
LSPSAIIWQALQRFATSFSPSAIWPSANELVATIAKAPKTSDPINIFMIFSIISLLADRVHCTFQQGIKIFDSSPNFDADVIARGVLLSSAEDYSAGADNVTFGGF